MDEMILAYNNCITKAKIDFTHKMVNTYPISVGVASTLLQQNVRDPSTMFYTIDKALKGNWFEKVK
jgi:hypothetical protein